MKSENERENVLYAQIRFRQKVLSQPSPEPSFYTLSVNGIKLRTAALTQKLIILMRGVQVLNEGVDALNTTEDIA